MDYFESVRRAIVFIEENLKEQIKLDDIAREACFSMFHFQRIFQAFVGESASEYIRKRRLTLASVELLESKNSILDIALVYRFESQASFTRAFKKMFGTTPGKYRSENIRAHFFEKKELTLSKIKHLNGGLTVEPKIINKESFKVVGMSCRASQKNKENIPQLWTNILPRMQEINCPVPGVNYYGISEMDTLDDLSSFNDETEFTYFVGAEVTEFKDIPEGMETREIPGQQYAVFTHKGVMATLNNTFDYIYGTWLPRADYEVTGTVDFEYYDERATGPEDPESVMEIYIPVKAKTE